MNVGEQAAQDAFDMVALAAARHIVDAKTTKQKALMLRLIKETLEADPESIVPIFQEVLKLPASRIEELKARLERTELSNVIQVSKEVSSRIDFLLGLETILFEKQLKKRLLERRQLHRILAHETWIFGEEWAITGDDDRLSKVLNKHLKHLGVDTALAEDKDEILTEDGKIMIPDFVFGRPLKTSASTCENLLVKLKKPSKRLSDEDVTQLRKYALAMVADEAFNQPNMRWEFWLVGNEVDASVKSQQQKSNRTYGVVQHHDKFDLIVKTWAEIIADARHRLTFVQNSLDYNSDGEQGLAALRARYASYLPDIPSEEADSESEEGRLRERPHGSHPSSTPPTAPLRLSPALPEAHHCAQRICTMTC